jgi:hypothetical protein
MNMHTWNLYHVQHLCEENEFYIQIHHDTVNTSSTVKVSENKLPQIQFIITFRSNAAFRGGDSAVSDAPSSGKHV